MVTIEDVRSFAMGLPRTTEGVVRGRVKFYIGRIVYVAFSLDETVMGFAFPKEERAALVESDPRFHLPDESDMRFNWVHSDLASLGADEARELVVDAWRMVVPQKLAMAYDRVHPDGPEGHSHPVPRPRGRD